MSQELKDAKKLEKEQNEAAANIAGSTEAAANIAGEVVVERTKVPKVKMTDVMLAFIMESGLISDEAKAEFAVKFAAVEKKATQPNNKARVQEAVLEALKANPAGLKNTAIYNLVAPTFSAEAWFHPYSFSNGVLYTILHHSAKEILSRDVKTGLVTIPVK